MTALILAALLTQHAVTPPPSLMPAVCVPIAPNVCRKPIRPPQQ